MRMFLKMAAAVGLAACLSTSASAQGPGGRGGMMGGGLNLLTDKAVQKELKLTEEQVEKATKAATEMREKMTEKMTELRDLDQAERREKMQGLMKEMGTESKKVTDELLKPEQSKRFVQLTLQRQGTDALATPDVQSKLKFTDEQKNKLKDLMTERQTKAAELFPRQGGGGAPDPEMMKKRADFQKETLEMVTALLTDDQKSTWKEMTGAPFTFSPPQRRPSGN